MKTHNKNEIELQLKEPLNKNAPQMEDMSNYDITRAAHPCICFFHIFFKICAFFS